LKFFERSFYFCRAKKQSDDSPRVLDTRGKSGQHRAFRYLTGRGPRGPISAEENNRPVAPRERGSKGEKAG